MGKEQDKLISLAREALRCAMAFAYSDIFTIDCPEHKRALEAIKEFKKACTPFDFLRIMGHLGD